MQDLDSSKGASATTTLVVLLGASEFARAKLESIPAFAASAQAIREYFLAGDGYGLPLANLLDLFNSPHEPSKILDDITDFLITRQREPGRESTVRDLILYYTGHGGFTARREYFLALRNTRHQYEGGTSLRMSDLAVAIRQSARPLRRFLILDCCFSAASFMEFQSAPLSAARVQTIDALPKEGTTLLCSSNARTVSVAPLGAKYTMFSGALLEVLHQGSVAIGIDLSMEQVGSLVTRSIRERYADDAVRPEVLSPDQTVEDIAKVPIFPNPAAQSLSRRTLNPNKELQGPDAAMSFRSQRFQTSTWRRVFLLYRPRRRFSWLPQMLAFVALGFVPVMVVASRRDPDAIGGAVALFLYGILFRAWAITSEFYSGEGSSRTAFARWTLFYRPHALRGWPVHALYWFLVVMTATLPFSIYEDDDLGSAVAGAAMMLLAALATRGWAVRYGRPT